MTNSVALVGLGQMGLPICTRLATRWNVIAFDISADRRKLADRLDRVTTTDTLVDLADCAQIVLSLPTPAISRSVIESLSAHLQPGSTVVETSTVLPDDVRLLAEILRPADVGVVDAAVLSGVAQMEGAAATLLVGGAPTDIASVRDLLEVLGAAGVREFGTLGSGMAAKVVNNGVAHAVMVVLIEAFAMARAEGVSLDSIADMLSRPDGGLIRPLTHRVMERVAAGDFTGGMPLDAARKDSTLALSMAQQTGVPLFATQAAQTVYDLASAAGLGREDYSAIATLWEGWINGSLSFGSDR